MMHDSMKRTIVIPGAILSVIIMAQAISFETNFVEMDDSRMIRTSDGNFAISHPAFVSGWKSVSINNNEISITTSDKKLISKKLAEITQAERDNFESIKTKLMALVRLGPMSPAPSVTSAKVTTFDRNGGVATMSWGAAGSSSSSSSSSSTGSDGMSISTSGKDNYIVSKKNFPHNWQRVFVNQNLTTVVYQDGRVMMQPRELFKDDEQKALAALDKEVKESSKSAEKVVNQLTESAKSPMDFVSKALGGLFG